MAYVKVEKNIDWAVNVVLMMFANDRRAFLTNLGIHQSTFDGCPPVLECTLTQKNAALGPFNAKKSLKKVVRGHTHLSKNTLKRFSILFKKGRCLLGWYIFMECLVSYKLRLRIGLIFTS